MQSEITFQDELMELLERWGVEGVTIGDINEQWSGVTGLIEFMDITFEQEEDDDDDD